MRTEVMGSEGCCVFRGSKGPMTTEEKLVVEVYLIEQKKTETQLMAMHLRATEKTYSDLKRDVVTGSSD